VAEVPFRSSGRNPTADRASTELRGVALGRLSAIDGDFGATRLLKAGDPRDGRRRRERRVSNRRAQK
jgi:hypothetical protein